MKKRQAWAAIGMLLGVTSSCGDDIGGVAKISSSVTSAATESYTAGSIPAGKVMVPGGRLVDKSCVFEVPTDATVTDTHDVILNGHVIHRHVPCTPAQMGYSPGESPWGSPVQPPSIDHAWVTYSWANARTISGLAYFDKLNAYWTIPSKPSNQSFQLLYYFPSFQSNTEIIQPVLQYGSNGDFGGHGWTIAAWYCWSSGCHHSPGLGGPNPGDTINGWINMVSSTVYTIGMRDLTTGTFTQYNWATTGPFNSVQGGVLEVYSVGTCDEFPPEGTIQFYGETIYQAGPSWNSFVQVSPSWSNNTTPGLTPACGYACQHGADWTTLYF